MINVNQSAADLIMAKPTDLEQVLMDCCQKGGFEACILVSDEGLPIATVTSAHDPEVTAAMAALLKDTVERVRVQLRLAHIDEVSALDENRVRVVCRYFTAGDNEFILAVVTTPSQRYRRITNQAIREIRRMWAAQV